MRLALLALLIPSVAFAVPFQVPHQGRLTSSDGVPLTGTHTIGFDIYDQAVGGRRVWTENRSVAFNNGYYSVVLGDNAASAPLSTDHFDGNPAYLELRVDGTTMTPRATIASVPYAMHAYSAQTLEDGASVNLGELRVDGQLIVNDRGELVASDGGTRLADLSCSEQGAVATWSQTFQSWGCLPISDSLDADDVLDVLATNSVALGGGSSMDGATLATLDDLATTVNESVVLGWIQNGSALQLGAGSTVGGGEIATVDQIPNAVSAQEVLQWVQDGALSLAAGTTVGGVAVATADQLLDAADVASILATTAITLSPSATLNGEAIATVADIPLYNGGDFALSDQACDVGMMVTGVNDDGTLLCEQAGGAWVFGPASTCNSAAAGTMRYQDERLELCDGEGWTLIRNTGQLFDFTSHIFTTCGQTGRLGPTLSMCRAAYNTTWDESSDHFEMNIQGIQRFTVPESGRYRITVTGAAGGSSTTYGTQPGSGTRMRGDFDLEQGDVLQILVGQQGQAVPRAGGAGGGSFVVKADGTPLIVAGGGVGGVDSNTRIGMWDATIGESGVNSSQCSGGSGGNGSTSCSGSYGGGGGGLRSSGANGIGASTGGQGFLQGGIGGNCDATCGSNAGSGGFGGGGGTYHDNRPGGGGGYSGGATGSENAGGGASFNSGLNQNNVPGAGTGQGQVEIERL